MLNRSKSLNEQITKKKDNLISQIHRLKTIRIKNNLNSPIKLPKINNMKYFSQSTDKTSLNNNHETTNTSNNTKTNISNRKVMHIRKFSSKKVGVQTEETNRIFPLKIKLKSLSNPILKKSSSADILLLKDIQSTTNFHRKLMEENQISCGRRLKEEYKILNNKVKEKENLNEIEPEKRGNKKLKTGIYGPSNNIVSVLMARIQRLRLDNEYRGVAEDLKELIKDEIIDAQVRLKMKPKSLVARKGEKNLLIQTKMNKYRYLTKMNLIKEINQNAITPLIIKDGNMMIKLIGEAFDNFKVNFKV